MKSGKVSDTVLKRSVLSEVQKVNQTVSCPRVGGGAAQIPPAENSAALLSALQTVVGEGRDTAYIAAVRAANTLAAAGGRAFGGSLAITVPEELDERELRRMMERAGAYFAEHGIEILGGHTAVSREVKAPVASVQLLGSREVPEVRAQQSCSREVPETGAQQSCSREVPETGGEKPCSREVPGTGAQQLCGCEVPVNGAQQSCSREVPEVRAQQSYSREVPDICEEAAAHRQGAFLGLDIVMTKYCGLGGTALLASHYKEELTKRYQRRFIERAEQLLQQVPENAECRLALENGAVYAHAAAEGGVFGALWELAEYAGCGLEIELRRIPILQETVEICEVFDCNPYQLRTDGVFLFLAGNGEGLCRTLAEAGIPAAVIGRTVGGLDRAVRNGEEVRYLEPNRVEEYERIRDKHIE